MSFRIWPLLFLLPGLIGCGVKSWPIPPEGTNLPDSIEYYPDKVRADEAKGN